MCPEYTQSSETNQQSDSQNSSQTRFRPCTGKKHSKQHSSLRCYSEEHCTKNNNDCKGAMKSHGSSLCGLRATPLLGDTEIFNLPPQSKA